MHHIADDVGGGYHFQLFAAGQVNGGKFQGLIVFGVFFVFLMFRFLFVYFILLVFFGGRLGRRLGRLRATLGRRQRQGDSD
jgi:hypothetical protein